MIVRKTLTLFLLFYIIIANAQDTIRIMQYNLLYYGANTSFCTQTNNNINDKDNALRQIINFVKPDIFSVNEISTKQEYHQRILDSILNINQKTLFKKANITNYSSSIIGNGFFYNSDKFYLYKEYALLGGTRDFNIYTLYYKTPELSWSNDTVFINCIVVHLKAGSTETDIASRDDEAKVIMEHLNAVNRKGNYFLMGDFNVYKSNEAPFQRFVNHSNTNIRFYDPLQQLGKWSQNQTYSSIHTQSTHTSSTCHVGGGMDDRFDFILTTMPVLTGEYHIKYIPKSYVTLGQDGKRYKKSLIDSPTNTSAPQNIITALYNMSDHLPVYIDVEVNQKPANIIKTDENPFAVEIAQNDLNEITLHIHNKLNDNLVINIYNMQGILVYSNTTTFTAPYTQYTINKLKNLNSGIYIINISGCKNFSVSKKILISI